MSIAQLVSEKVFYSLVWSNINQCFDCLIKTRAPFFDINTMPISDLH